MIMNQEELSNLKDQYTEMIVDGLDHKDMYRIVFDYLRSEMESVNEEELRDEIIDYYDEETWEDLKTSWGSGTMGVEMPPKSCIL